jgi:lysine N6-hydroxylase
MTGEVIDVVGIGLGPSNLSFAALSAKVPELNVSMLERQRSLRWHPGMMVDEAELQVSYLKDLVTLVDPTSEFSFLNHLAQQGRLYRFLLATAGAPTFRAEFADYYQWVAQRLPSVHWDTTVAAVELAGEELLVHTDSGATFRTPTVLLGSGRTPNVPDFVTGHRLDTVFHASRFRLIDPDTTNRDIVVIGGGQSGAEIVRSVLSDSHALPASVTWITSRVNFLPLDDSPFVNEWFQPRYVHHFVGLPSDRQDFLLDRQRLASDGVSESLLRDIYRRLYYLDVVEAGRVRHQLLTSRRVVDLVEHGGRYLVHVTADDQGRAERYEADLVICCTGYRAQLPAYLEPIRDLLVLDGDRLSLTPDYRVRWSGPDSVRLYAQNFGERSHGIADPNLSLVPWRCARIINSITGRQVYRIDDSASTVCWASPDEPSLRLALTRPDTGGARP